MAEYNTDERDDTKRDVEPPVTTIAHDKFQREAWGPNFEISNLVVGEQTERSIIEEYHEQTQGLGWVLQTAPSSVAFINSWASASFVALPASYMNPVQDKGTEGVHDQSLNRIYMFPARGLSDCSNGLERTQG